jgi:hypothetical protein
VSDQARVAGLRTRPTVPAAVNSITVTSVSPSFSAAPAGMRETY